MEQRLKEFAEKLSKSEERTKKLIEQKIGALREELTQEMQERFGSMQAALDSLSEDVRRNSETLGAFEAKFEALRETVETQIAQVVQKIDVISEEFERVVKETTEKFAAL